MVTMNKGSASVTKAAKVNSGATKTGFVMPKVTVAQVNPAPVATKTIATTKVTGTANRGQKRRPTK